MTDIPDPSAAGPFRRVIKSYVLRAGRTGPGQQRAYEQFGPRFLLSYRPEPLDITAAFGRSAPLIMEIGFGMGGATAHIAQVRPNDNFLCCEVHEPGVGALLKLCGEQGIENIRIFRHDAVEVLDHMLPEQSLDGVHIFFPDPWHKTRHHKRRLIQGPFVQRLARHLKPGGYLHLATDWEPGAPAPEHGGRLCTQAGLPAADQVREPGPQAGPRRVGPGVRAALNRAGLRC
jgi:tRNA (guanine-N7-)-methyltransferase